MQEKMEEKMEPTIEATMDKRETIFDDLIQSTTELKIEKKITLSDRMKDYEAEMDILSVPSYFGFIIAENGWSCLYQ